MDLMELAKLAVAFLGGGIATTYFNWLIDNLKFRRQRRVDLIAAARELLTDELCSGDPYGQGPKYNFMNLPAFHALNPHLSEAFRPLLVKTTHTGHWHEAYLIKEAFGREIGRIERSWKLI